MSRIRDARIKNDGSLSDKLYRKATQEWDLAGAARADGDLIAAGKHTENARELERQAREAE